MKKILGIYTQEKDTHAGWAWNERINHVCVVYEMILETIAQFIFLLFLLLFFFLGPSSYELLHLHYFMPCTQCMGGIKNKKEMGWVDMKNTYV